jgi:hypothetical protein
MSSFGIENENEEPESMIRLPGKALNSLAEIDDFVSDFRTSLPEHSGIQKKSKPAGDVEISHLLVATPED